MRHIYLSILCMLFIVTVHSQKPVKLKSGTFIHTESAKNPKLNPADFSNTLFNGQHYLWLQFEKLPGLSVKEKLERDGIRFFGYLPENTFLVSIPADYQYNFSLTPGKVMVMNVPFSSKISPAINALMESENLVDIQVSFITALSKQEITELFKKAIPEITEVKESTSQTVRIILPGKMISKLAAHPLVHFIEPGSAIPVLENDEAITNHRINMLHNENGLGVWDYTGRNVVVAVGDDGFVGPHIDFQGRILVNTFGFSIIQHSDHVSGIITGAGNMNPKTRGQAPGALLRAYNGFTDLNSFPEIYDNDSVRITSHSLGQDCNAGYDTDARESDLQTNQYPLLMHVHSAGNSGNETCDATLGRSFKTITGGYKQGKNIIATANLTKEDIRNSSSSRGPSKDGRIKPDISGVGTSVTSTQPNNKYTSYTGTSMACPAIAGTLAVMQEAYRKIYGMEATGAFLKALLLNTADDLGNAGPDFSYGWGRVNAMRALQCLEDGRFQEGTITQGETKLVDINIPANVAVAKIMVYWNDEAGLPAPAKALVNDIDILVKKAETVYQPWLMDAGETPTIASCEAPAVKGADHLNNVEQVEIELPDAGIYQLELNGYSIPSSSQSYHIIIDYIYKNKITLTYPFGGESLVPGETYRLRWDAPSATNESFTIKLNNLSGNPTQEEIATNINASKRYYDWKVPSNISGKYSIEVKNQVASDVSDFPFSILPVPANIKLNARCANTSVIKYNLVVGADSYDIMRLGEKYMELITTSTTDSAIIENAGFNEIKYYAVRARKEADIVGMRSIAVSHSNSSTEDCLTLPVTLISFTGQKSTEGILLNWRTTDEINVTEYVIERSASPEFVNYSLVGSVKARNKTGMNNYQLLDAGVHGGSRYYYRLKTVEPGKRSYSNVLEFDVSNFIVGLSIFPIPVKNSINIKSNGIKGAYKLSIYSTTGILLQTENISLTESGALQISANKLASGSYYLQITDISGNLVFRKSFIKQ